jgi:hypothetical protein
MGSYHVATATVQLLRSIIASSVWRNVEDLILKIKDAGQKLIAAQKSEFAITSMVKQHVKDFVVNYIYPNKGSSNVVHCERRVSKCSRRIGVACGVDVVGSETDRVCFASENQLELGVGGASTAVETINVGVVAVRSGGRCDQLGAGVGV